MIVSLIALRVCTIVVSDTISGGTNVAVNRCGVTGDGCGVDGWRSGCGVDVPSSVALTFFCLLCARFSSYSFLRCCSYCNFAVGLLILDDLRAIGE